MNGLRLASGASKYNISRRALERGVLIQTINFQYNFSDEGFYIHNLLIDPWDLDDVLEDESHTRCRDHYRYARRRLYPISFAILPFILTTYSK